MSILYEKESLKQIPASLSIVYQTGRTHPGLGIKLLLAKIIDVADMGCLLVGLKGIGKTRTLQGLKPIAHKKFYALDFKTLAATGQDNAFQEELSNKSITWVSYDLARQSVVVSENTMKLISALLTEGEIHGDAVPYKLDIQNSKLSWLGAVTYPIFKEILQSSQWEGCFADRILRAYTFDTTATEPNENKIYAKLPNKPNYPPLENVELDLKEKFYWDIADLLRSQFERKRSQEYARRMLKASASLNGREEVLPIDAEIIKLFKLEITAESMVAYREKPTDFLNINVDALLLIGEALVEESVGIMEVSNQYFCPDDWVKEVLSKCKGIFDVFRHDYRSEPRIKLSKNFVDYFIKPQLDFEYFCIDKAHKFMSTKFKKVVPSLARSCQVKPKTRIKKHSKIRAIRKRKRNT